jgi:DNA-binding NarL/FixJ family response regulator
MKRITVLLADDHPMVRDGLRTVLESERDFQVVGEAENGQQTVELIQKLEPAVVVMDISMLVVHGLEATRIIRNTTPGTKVIMLSLHDEDAQSEQATDLGPAGYLLKHSSIHLLTNAVRDVLKGCMCSSASTPKRFHDQKPKQSTVRGIGPARRPVSADWQLQNPS